MANGQNERIGKNAPSLHAHLNSAKSYEGPGPLHPAEMGLSRGHFFDRSGLGCGAGPSNMPKGPGGLSAKGHRGLSSPTTFHRLSGPFEDAKRSGHSAQAFVSRKRVWQTTNGFVENLGMRARAFFAHKWFRPVTGDFSSANGIEA
jgi:hypothetical protein